jgi:hypothetical protein
LLTMLANNHTVSCNTVYLTIMATGIYRTDFLILKVSSPWIMMNINKLPVPVSVSDNKYLPCKKSININQFTIMTLALLPV